MYEQELYTVAFHTLGMYEQELYTVAFHTLGMYEQELYTVAFQTFVQLDRRDSKKVISSIRRTCISINLNKHFIHSTHMYILNIIH
jgi:hypothetical protein